jgi:hypothetical protein
MPVSVCFVQAVQPVQPFFELYYYGNRVDASRWLLILRQESRSWNISLLKRLDTLDRLDGSPFSQHFSRPT